MKRPLPSSRRPFRRVSLPAALLLACLPALGQNFSQPFDKQIQWFAYSGDHAVAGKWGLHFDGGWRQVSHADWNQWLVRPGVNYQWSRRVQLSAAYSYFNTHPAGLAWDEQSVPEHRLQEQILIQTPVRKIALRHRVRVDQRFLGSGFAENSQRTWNLQHRLRYMIRTELPLRKGASERPVVYAGVHNEILFRLGYTGGSNFDQNRLYGGIGARPHKEASIEAGVFHQRFQPMAGGRMENNYVFVLTVSNQLSLSRLLGRE
ncbi:MAG: DUF2490 domain-containing protein [Acidobacteria bacterium]|nr:DUF2490 domain-containing protein [Acidobacteriota bacterium]